MGPSAAASRSPGGLRRMAVWLAFSDALPGVASAAPRTSRVIYRGAGAHLVGDAPQILADEAQDDELDSARSSSLSYDALLRCYLRAAALLTK